MIKLMPVQTAYRYVELLYEMLGERTNDAEVNISHSRMPSFAEHKAFVNSGPYRCWYFGVVNTKALKDVVGATYLTTANEIGIQVRLAHRGKGYGKAMLAKLLETHEPLPALTSVRQGRFVANINPNNAVSIKLFTGLGARLIQHTYRFD